MKGNEMAGRKRAREKTYTGKTGRYGIMVMVLVLTAFAIVLGTRISLSNGKIKNLDRQINDLEEQYDGQEKRALELKEKKEYVMTKKYVEEMARKLGLVYPDEIIYKPSN